MHRSGCNTSLDWQVKTTYSWCGLTGRKSLFKTNLTGVPSLTSPPPSLLFVRAPFYFTPLPTIWTPGTGYIDPIGFSSSSARPLSFSERRCAEPFTHYNPSQVVHQSIPAAPKALAFFLPWMANSWGWGLELSNPLGWGRKKRANATSSVNTATFFIDRTVG